jgi:nucleoside-diphosphate-sugar epimerase
MRIFFTGGSGKAGHHVAPYLASQGHQVTNGAEVFSLLRDGDLASTRYLDVFFDTGGAHQQTLTEQTGSRAAPGLPD